MAPGGACAAVNADCPAEVGIGGPLQAVAGGAAGGRPADGKTRVGAASGGVADACRWFGWCHHHYR